MLMRLNEAFYKYIYEHKDDNTNVLRLQQKESEEFDVLFAIDQIEARKKIKNKLPHWHQNIYLLFPSVISTEQASSEETAIYKSELLSDKDVIKLCDLTGGLGIDTYYFAQRASSVTYIERYPLYCEPQIICVNICSKNKEVFSFSYLQERMLPCSNYASSILTYLYEPNSSILKSGAFKMLGQVFCVDKLHVNSHLYTSDKYMEDFPGRKFKVIDIYDFSSKNSKIIAQKYTKASISSRNFPLRPDELKKKLKIKDGEEYYLFATTLYPNKKIIIITQKAQK